MPLIGKNFVFVYLCAVCFLTGCSHKIDIPTTDIMVYIEADSWSGPFTRNAILPISKISIPIFPQPVFTSVDIKSVEIVDVDYGKCLMVTLSERASYDLYKISIDSLDNRLILTVNGKVVGFSVIDHAINDGTILVFAEMRLQDLEPLVLELNETIARINKMKKER